MKVEEKIELLMSLGLTSYQAKTYLALFQKSPATIKDIAEISRISRPDIYRVIAALQKQGLIERLITRPASFQAVPIEQVLPVMLKRKMTEQNNLVAKLEEFLYDSRNNLSANSKGDEAVKDFVIVPRKVAIIGKLKKALDESKVSVCTVTTKKRFSSAIVTFEQGYRKALERNVRIKICTEKQVISKEASRILKSLVSNPHFEVQFFSGEARAVVSVYDGKEAVVTMTADAHLTEASAVWSNNPCFVILAQNYFETQWNKASSLKTPSKKGV